MGMPIDGDLFLERLAKVPWLVAARTFGNDHATLLGLLVHWWIAEQPNTHTALEGGPGFGYHENACTYPSKHALCGILWKTVFQLLSQTFPEALPAMKLLLPFRLS